MKAPTPDFEYYEIPVIAVVSCFLLAAVILIIFIAVLAPFKVLVIFGIPTAVGLSLALWKYLYEK